MNSITIFCEHSCKDSIEIIKSVIAYAELNNCVFIRPDQLDEFFSDRLGGKYVLLTFDDGQEYKYKDIAPFLRENKIKAISFAIPLHWGFHSIYTSFDYYLNNKDVFEVGSHSLTHTMVIKSLKYDGFDVTSPRLIYYGDKNQKVSYNYGLIEKEFNKMRNRIETDNEYDTRLKREVEFSKEWIERAIGVECRYFAYPYGVYNDNVVSAVKNAGYKMAFTVNRSSSSVHTIPRIDVSCINEQKKQYVINNVIVNAQERLSQNDNDVKYGIFK